MKKQFKPQAKPEADRETPADAPRVYSLEAARALPEVDSAYPVTYPADDERPAVESFRSADGRLMRVGLTDGGDLAAYQLTTTIEEA